MMNEQVVRMGVMWILAGLSAGWLAETFIIRRGYGLIVDMGLGVAAGLLGGGAFLAMSGRPGGMLVTFVFAFAVATGMILAQRLCWPCDAGAQERKARRRLSELSGSSLGEKGTGQGPHGTGNGMTGDPAPTGALMRVATTGIYLLRGVPLDLQRAARVRAVSDGTTLRQVLLKGLGEYAAGTWTPRADDKLPGLRGTSSAA
jgi:uncharacterized membrane protein YeaQ/YmgE (transglycosylase-associated protein family)